VLSPLDGFEATLRAFAAEGGRGVNVTVPFKFQALGLAARRSARALLAGAANILKLDEADGWLADNTDGVGLVRDIEQGAGFALAGRRVLLLGAGGAAAGALGPLIAAGRTFEPLRRQDEHPVEHAPSGRRMARDRFSAEPADQPHRPRSERSRGGISRAL